jgi:hypothetical protein
MCEMPHSDRSFLVNIGKERTLVIDLKPEDAVLIRKSKGGAVDRAVRSFGGWV